MKFSPKKGAILALAALLVVPSVSFAQTTPSMASLQAQLQELLAKVQSLQAQFNAVGGVQSNGNAYGNGNGSGIYTGPGLGKAIGYPTSTPTPVGPCFTFSSNLSIGMSGQAVSALQQALQKDGEQVSVSGKFDDQTASAVTGFQEKYASKILTPSGLAHGTGYVGPATRSALNGILGCGPITGPTNPPITVNPPCMYPMGYPALQPAGSVTGSADSAGQPTNNLAGRIPCYPPNPPYPCAYPPMAQSGTASPDHIVMCYPPTTTYPCPLTTGGAVSNIVCNPPPVVNPSSTPVTTSSVIYTLTPNAGLPGTITTLSPAFNLCGPTTAAVDCSPNRFNTYKWLSSTGAIVAPVMGVTSAGLQFQVPTSTTASVLELEAENCLGTGCTDTPLASFSLAAGTPVAQ